MLEMHPYVGLIRDDKLQLIHRAYEASSRGLGAGEVDKLHWEDFGPFPV